MASLSINQGTNSAINFDLSGTINTQVVAIGYGTVSTLGTLPNVPGGTLGSVIGMGSVSNIGSIGMLNAGTITTIPNIPGGSIVVTTGTQNVGTINTGTINIGTVVGKDASGAARTGNPIPAGGTDGGGTIYGFLTDTKGQQYLGGGTVSMLNAGTISTLPNLPGGSIAVTAGTIASVGTIGTLGLGTITGNLGTIGTLGLGTITGNLGTMGTLGTIQNQGSLTNIGQVYNAGTLQGGTINAGTFVMTAGTITGGTIHTTGTVLDNPAAVGTFTISLGSLANSSSGVGRQSTLLDNTSNKYLSANIACQLTTGVAGATANSPIYVYLIRSDNGAPIIDDGAGASDAGITIINSPLLGVINVSGTAGNTPYYGIFDTSPLGPLGPKWGVGLVNNSGGSLQPTPGSHSITYTGFTKLIS